MRASSISRRRGRTRDIRRFRADHGSSSVRAGATTRASPAAARRNGRGGRRPGLFAKRAHPAGATTYPRRRAVAVSRSRSSSIDQPKSSPTTKSRDASGHDAVAPARTCREQPAERRCSSAQRAEVAVGDVGKRGDTNRGTTLLELVRESSTAPPAAPPASSNPIRPRRRAPDDRRCAGRPPGVRTESASISAFEHGSSRLAARKTSCPRSSSARACDGSGATTRMSLEPSAVFPAKVTSKCIATRIPVEPLERVGTFPRVVGPARGDQPQRSARKRVPRLGRMEDRRICRIRNHDRITQLEPELPVLVEAVSRLQDRLVRELAVDARDPHVGAVVEASIDADRPVDAMHHAHAWSGKPPQPREVEVEGVVETCLRPCREPVRLDAQRPTL